MKRLGVACATASLLAACGGAMAPEPSRSGAPSDQKGADATFESTQSAPTVSAPATAPTPDTYALPPQTVAAARELDRAQARVEASLGDCATACRALASMESSAHHLCSLAGGGSSDCTSATARVAAARDRVVAACGPCR